MEDKDKKYEVPQEEVLTAAEPAMVMTSPSVFNPAQLEIIDMMSFVKSSQTLSQLKQAISDFFVKQAQEEIDHLWETGDLNEDKVESFRHLHERTPYK